MRIGIIGTGKIAGNCLRALRDADGIECTAICGRNMQAASQLATEFGIARVYHSYRELLEDSEVDVIYVALINSLHAQYSREALLADKHVICEKPFTSTAAETRDLIALAKERGCFLFEAITIVHSPNYHQVKQHLSELGKIRLVQCNYSQYSSRYDRYLAGEIAPVFDPALSGGALYDINIYNLHLVIGLFGAPESVQYFANFGENGVDTSGIALLRYPDFQAECCGAKDSESPGHLLIQGEKGWFQVKGAPSAFQSVDGMIAGKAIHFDSYPFAHRMTQEFVVFAEQLRTRNFAKCHQELAHTLRVMEAAEAARISAGIRFPADV